MKLRNPFKRPPPPPDPFDVLIAIGVTVGAAWLVHKYPDLVIPRPEIGLGEFKGGCKEANK